MNWISTAIFTVVFYSIFDLFVKLASGKINDNLGAAIMNIVAFGVSFGWFLIRSRLGDLANVTKMGLIYSIMAGVMVGLASLFFIKMFSLGVNLSIGVPLIRIGMVVLGSLLGVLIFKEGLTVRYMFGFLLSVCGLYLVMTAK